VNGFQVLRSEQGGYSIASAVEQIEKRYLEEMKQRHDEDKQLALDRQKEAYELHISKLKSVLFRFNQ
jgi:hypothetical protein